MAKHEFGIIPQTPSANEIFEEYEPEKYDCISVDDELVELLDSKLSSVSTFWHSLNRPAKGLAYCGITLIPPESIASFLATIENCADFCELKSLLLRAQAENKFIIHYGL